MNREGTRGDAVATSELVQPLRRARDLLGAVGGSVDFDHAVGYYDETRGLSPEVQDETVRRLRDALGPAASVIEVGAGTGQIAIPLARSGLRVLAVDLSAPMLRRLEQHARDQGAHVPTVVGDATRLPIGDAACDAVVMRHVLHLVADWRQALDEVVRIVRPGGSFLVSITDYTGLYRTLQERFLRAAGGLPVAVGLRPDDAASLEHELAGHGATGSVLEPVRGQRTLTVSSFLENMERGVYTWTWAASPTVRRHAVRSVRRWARRHLGRLDRPVESEFAIEWRAFRLPGRFPGGEAAGAASLP
jgi:ubiquinone/menaquinone biosynthesis C-methylase UbiE